MIRQRILVERLRNGVLDTSQVTSITFIPRVDDEGQLSVTFEMPDDLDGRMPVEIIRFNRFETAKIRTVLRHTEG